MNCSRFVRLLARYEVLFGYGLGEHMRRAVERPRFNLNSASQLKESPMHECFVDVTSKHGTIPCFFVAPQESGQFPAIILYMDAPGIREELRNVARRIAKQGYACILPDLYHRYGTLRFDLPRRHDGMSAVIRAAYLSLSDDNINEDTAGLVGFLEAQPQVRSGKIGSVGFCMSGRFVTTTALRFATLLNRASGSSEQCSMRSFHLPVVSLVAASRASTAPTASFSAEIILSLTKGAVIVLVPRPLIAVVNAASSVVATVSSI